MACIKNDAGIRVLDASAKCPSGQPWERHQQLRSRRIDTHFDGSAYDHSHVAMLGIRDIKPALPRFGP